MDQLDGQHDGDTGGRQNGNFQGVQGATGVSFGNPGAVFEGLGRDLNRVATESYLRVLDGPMKQFHKIVLRQRVQLEDLRATQQGTVDCKEGITGSGSNQGDRAGFDIR